MWACYFVSPNGEVLRSDSFDTPEAACMWGVLVESRPDAHVLERADGTAVLASAADLEQSFSVEPAAV